MLIPVFPYCATTFKTAQESSRSFRSGGWVLGRQLRSSTMESVYNRPAGFGDRRLHALAFRADEHQSRPALPIERSCSSWGSKFLHGRARALKALQAQGDRIAGLLRMLLASSCCPASLPSNRFAAAVSQVKHLHLCQRARL